MVNAVGNWLGGVSANLFTAFVLYTAAARFAFPRIEDWRVARRVRIDAFALGAREDGWVIILDNDTGERLRNVLAVWHDNRGGLHTESFDVFDQGRPAGQKPEVQVGSIAGAYLVELDVTFGLPSGNVFKASLVNKGQPRRRLKRFRERRFWTWGPFDFVRRWTFVVLYPLRRLAPRERVRRAALAILIIFVIYAIINDPESSKAITDNARALFTRGLQNLSDFFGTLL